MNPNREEVLFALALEQPADERAHFSECQVRKRCGVARTPVWFRESRRC